MTAPAARPRRCPRRAAPKTHAVPTCCPYSNDLDVRRAVVAAPLARAPMLPLEGFDDLVDRRAHRLGHRIVDERPYERLDLGASRIDRQVPAHLSLLSTLRSLKNVVSAVVEPDDVGTCVR